MSTGRFVRLAETERARITLSVDGESVSALAGDTLLVALLTSRNAVRRSEFGGENRAGLCLMGACQDCWVWSETGERLRACSTPAAEGMRIVTEPVEATWPG